MAKTTTAGIQQALRQRIAAKETATKQERRRLVLAVTAGEKIDPEAAAELMTRLGITGAELEADCELLERRQRWAAMIAAKPATEKAYEQVTADAAAFDDEWAKVVEQYEARSAAITDRRTAIAAALSDADDAARRLIETSAGEFELAEVERLNGELTELQTTREQLRRRGTDAAARAAETESLLNRAETRSDRLHESELRTTLAGLTARKPSIAAELAELDAAISAKLLECDAARAALLRPDCI